MKRLYLLSMLIMLFVSTSALASPRTFSQAKAIAERKAALLGIKIDKKAAAKAPSMNGGITTAVSPSTFSHLAKTRDLPLFRAMTICQRL